MSRSYLVDSDAFFCLYGLRCGTERLLDVILDSSSLSSPILLGGYSSSHELIDLQDYIGNHRLQGRIEIKSVKARTKEYKVFKDLRKKIDKGEAEALAVAISIPRAQRPLFVSRDTKALAMAKKKSVPRTDVMGFIVECVVHNIITRRQAADAVDIWKDPEQQLCRPKDFEGFATTFKKRKGKHDYF